MQIAAQNQLYAAKYAKHDQALRALEHKITRFENLIQTQGQADTPVYAN